MRASNLLWGIVSLGLVSCQSPKYYWGHYEPLIYQRYADTEPLPVAAQIDLLQQDIQKAEALSKPLPPGFYAHLGYLYLHVGNTVQAKSFFNMEKSFYPESTVFMDRLIEGIGKE